MEIGWKLNIREANNLKATMAKGEDIFMAAVSEKQLEENKTYVFVKGRSEMIRKREGGREENAKGRQERRKVSMALDMIDGIIL